MEDVTQAGSPAVWRCRFIRRGHSFAGYQDTLAGDMDRAGRSGAAPGRKVALVTGERGFMLSRRPNSATAMYYKPPVAAAALRRQAAIPAMCGASRRSITLPADRQRPDQS